VAEIVLDLIQIKRGLKVNLPILLPGELALCTDIDAEELYVGTLNGNILLAAKNGNGQKTVVADSTTNGYITVDGVQLQVYDDSGLVNLINNKANKSDLHQHSNESVLNQIEQPYTNVDKNKLNNIEEYAQKNTVTSVNGQVGDVIIETSNGVSTVTDSTINGNIVVNGSEVKVYDDAEIISHIAEITNNTIFQNLYLKSPNGTTYKISVSDSGDLITSLHGSDNSTIAVVGSAIVGTATVA
jgi:ribosomal protein S8